MLTLLVDADSFAYRFSKVAEETTKWDEETTTVHVKSTAEEVSKAVCDYLYDLMDTAAADKLVACLSCATVDGFRYKLWNGYKQHRKDAKPVLLEAAKQAIRDTFKTYERPGLEADDIVGILATHPTLIKGEKVIVSIDKDLRTVPCWLWNPDVAASYSKITEPEADANHFRQTLIGDTTDGYPGCPGIGPKKAEAVLWGDPVDPSIKSRRDQWVRIVQAFEKKGLTEDDALLQARLARILRAEDYDFKTKEVRLWTPPEA